MDLERRERVCWVYGALLLLPFWTMVEQGWILLEVMLEHLQDLMSQGFMTAVELVTYHVPKDPASRVPAGRYVVASTAFYMWGFIVPSYWFLRSLLQFYDLELHHLTPLEILHIAALVTLYEAYLGIEAHFNLWNHFFRTRLP
jgi:hypothetical protein